MTLNPCADRTGYEAYDVAQALVAQARFRFKLLVLFPLRVRGRPLMLV